MLTFRDGVLVVGGGNAAYVFKRGNRLFRYTQTLTPPAADGVDSFPVALRYEGGTLLASGSRSTAPSVVYVFERDSTGVFVRRAKVKASDGTAGDSFGASISMTSRLFVVGSPGNAAYTFRRNSSGNWVQAQKLVPAVPADGFGTAVAIDRDMILVGAPFVDLEGGDRGSPTPDGHIAGGAVFGFLPGVSGYIESFKLRPRPDERFEYEQFGSAIAMSGARIAVTATGFRPPVRIQPEGLVFTYTRNGSSVLARGITSRQGRSPEWGCRTTRCLSARFSIRHPAGSSASAWRASTTTIYSSSKIGLVGRPRMAPRADDARRIEYLSSSPSPGAVLRAPTGVLRCAQRTRVAVPAV